MGKGELLFLLRGLQWTLMLSAVGFVCGTFTGLGVALARTSGFRFVERMAAGYIALFQGTPLLMQLFVVYYGLALYGMKLDAWVAIAIGFTLHASAYLGEIWRGAIEAVPRGQVEAAKALRLGYFWRMKEKYIIRDFHPLVFFLTLGLFLTGLGGALGAWIVYHRVVHGALSPNTVIFDVFCLIMGMQMLFFAMWMDMEHNKGLR